MEINNNELLTIVLIGILSMLIIVYIIQLTSWDVTTVCGYGYKPIAIYYNGTVVECERVMEGCPPGVNQCWAMPRFNISRLW